MEGSSGSAKVSSSTSSAAMNLQGAEIRAAKEDASVDVSEDVHVVLSELDFETNEMERELLPSENDMIANIARCQLDAAQGGGEKSLNNLLKLM